MLNSIMKVWLNGAGNGAPDISAFRQFYNETATYLTALDGWNDETGLTLTTQPKLLGNGSYITGVQNENKIVRLTLVSSLNNELALRKYVFTLKNHILSHLTSPVNSRMELHFYNPENYGVVVRSEKLFGYLTRLSDVMEYNDGEDLGFIIEFTVVNPVIETV